MLLAATDSVHTSAAIADYLDHRPAERVRVVTVGETRDGREALNAARVRLAGADVEEEVLSGDPADPEAVASAIREAAAEHGADAILCGRGQWADDGTDPNSVTGRLVATANRPVIVVPDPATDAPA
jgi:nucleotide-binding universal stress UspA family protein